MPRSAFLGFGLMVLLWPQWASAHFQVLRSSTDVVEAGSPREVTLDLAFTHPMENGPAMEMAVPRRFGVAIGGETKDLLPVLTAVRVQGKQAFSATYPIDAPGAHVFFVEPTPYWEPAEKKLIIHYTKAVVEAYGLREGWDALVGFPVEIEPLTRPYGLWTGNLFRGVVRKDGQPVPFATVEVEYLNDEKRVEPPNGALVTQIIKADGSGVFSYAMPRAGWWGFAALIDGDEKLPGPGGTPADVELGGLIWVRTVDMTPAKR